MLTRAHNNNFIDIQKICRFAKLKMKFHLFSSLIANLAISQQAPKCFTSKLIFCHLSVNSNVACFGPRNPGM
uniref:Uncharacterized protein n=1 Tax=Arundo donax TaxID=35708 RepID=A0A0A9IND6_ARUDO